jgi:hypothetical protein
MMMIMIALPASAKIRIDRIVYDPQAQTSARTRTSTKSGYRTVVVE